MRKLYYLIAVLAFTSVADAHGHVGVGFNRGFYGGYGIASIYRYGGYSYVPPVTYVYAPPPVTYVYTPPVQLAPPPCPHATVAQQGYAEPGYAQTSYAASYGAGYGAAYGGGYGTFFRGVYSAGNYIARGFFRGTGVGVVPRVNVAAPGVNVNVGVRRPVVVRTRTVIRR